MNNTDQQRIADYYDRLVDQYGHDPRACDASSSQALETRYGVLSEVADLNSKSVLEVGCGFGDLGVFLRKKYPTVQYVGIDVASRMIGEARRAHPDLSFRHHNLLNMSAAEQFDVVLAQGIFYLLGEDAESKMRLLIEKMFSLSKEAVAFCAISSWASKKLAEEFYADPAKLLVCCRTLTPNIVLRHDYLPNDVALYLYKKKTK